MTKAQAEKRIQKLRKEIDHHRYQYHVLNTQSISDAALDALKHELATLEEEYPDLITPDSPTQRVAGEALEQFVKITHPTRMLSLSDAFDREDIEAWVQKLHRIDPRAAIDFFVEPKIDGLAISLIYENGVLKTAATRGDGRVGEDVTANIRTIESVPLTLRSVRGVDLSGDIEVRGEVYMTKKVFDRINDERQQAGEAVYMNPRNTAAGSIRQLDPRLVAQRELQFLAYAIPTDLGQKSHHDEHALLTKLGFPTDPLAQRCANVDAVMQLYERWQQKRDALPHQIDGMVMIIDDTAQFERFGVVGKAPRGAIALKFPAEQTTTIVEDIQVQVGRTGALTPVAHLRPVVVAGSTVQRATLHNVDEIARLDVRIGDTVIIEKAGDIIPDIVEVLPALRTGAEKKFRMPKKCPACHNPVKRMQDGVAYYCLSTTCPAQHRETIYHFVSKKGFNIEGLGPKIIDTLLDADVMHTVADIFDLTEQDLSPLERFAETSARNIVASIKKASSIELSRCIYALGIRHVGEQTAVLLAEQFGTMQKIRGATEEQLTAIHDVGSAAANSITAYFADPQNVAVLDALMERITIRNPKQQARTGKLQGKSFVFTGTLERMTRDDAKAIVRQNGGAVLSSISKNLDYLVVGDQPGSKVTKAEKVGVKIITEDQFFQMVDERSKD